MIMEEIELENKQKVSKAVSESNKNRANPICVHVDAIGNSERNRSTNTREQLAKMSGVGTGTVARYQAIMKTDNEELKQKVNTGEVPVGTAYREIKTRVCKVCGKEKKIIDFKDYCTWEMIHTVSSYKLYMDFDWDNRLICPISCDLKHGFHRVQKTLVYKGKLVVFFGFFDNFKEF